MEHDNHGFEAKMVEDSIGEHGIRLSTLQLRYPRFIHAEAKTHRVIKQGSEECESIALTQNHALMDDPALSRNASSSRAIPVAKMLEQVRNAPAMPIHWGKNQPGMQAHEELGWAERDYVKAKWFEAAGKAADIAEEMMNEGAHKQVVNRILEPFQFISVIVTASEWANFFILRDHPDAQPEIRFLAQLMKQAMDASTPVLRSPDHTR
jgi:thymidylate synthase ThyX